MGFVVKRPSKNARPMFSSKLGGAGSCFQSGSKKSRAGAKISREGCPRPDLTSLEVWGGGTLTSSVHMGSQAVSREIFEHNRLKS